MITPIEIEQALGLSGVSFSVSAEGRTRLTANEPVTDAMQAKVQAWYDAGAVPDYSAPATPDQIAEARYAVEAGGVSVATSSGTHRVDTRREIEARWINLRLAAMANPAFTQGWKTLDHGFVVLTAADIFAVCAAVEAHVAAAFTREAQLLANPPALEALEAAFTDLAS